MTQTLSLLAAAATILALSACTVNTSPPVAVAPATTPAPVVVQPAPSAPVVVQPPA